ILVVDSLRDNRMPVRDGAEEVARAIGAHDATRYVLVGHSKGGLIGKAVLARGVEREGVVLDGLVAIATPFAGSTYARFMPGRTLRSLSPGDETIVGLA